MTQAKKRSTLRNIFLVLFVISTLVLVLLAAGGIMLRSAFIEAAPGENPSTEMPAKNSEGLGFTVAVGSAITSITSLVGFIVTTMISWRKEKREASLADVERRKLEVELEKSKLELEEMKKEKNG